MKRAQIAFICSVAILALLAASGVQFGSGAESESKQTAASASARRLSKTIIVTSAADSGPGTLRQALLDAQSGDTITFDPTVFPPATPITIFLNTMDGDSALPVIHQGGLTIDASNAGVILDGSEIQGDWVIGLVISSDWNTIRGLQIVNFTGSGIALCTASHNTIGGDRNIGTGPIGQGNLSSKNGNGIDVCDQGYFNTIIGNIVGTDPTGTLDWGNRQDGIWIENGLTNNIIGPDNIAAYNGYAGILIQGPDALGNTITQNSIHDNKGMGIELRDGGNALLDPPLIWDFDVVMGNVGGVACANCTVEIFSDSGGQGEIYEGRTIAGNGGDFSLNKGSPLTGPNLTSTATDTEGNTSQFSVPRSGSGKALILQEGNKLPKIVLQTRQSSQLENNRIGGDVGNWYFERNQDNTSLYDSLLTNVVESGVKWIRTNFWSLNPLNWQEVLRAPGVYEIPPDADHFITDLTENGIEVVLTLSAGAGLNGQEYGENCWGGPGWGVLGDQEPEWWFNTQEDRDRFIEYAQFMVENFKSRVNYYEIWNEADSGENPGDCRGGVAVDDYALLVQQVVPMIKQTDPLAKIVAGVVGRFYEEDRQWLQSMLNSGVTPVVDAISWHPFYGESPLLYSGEYPEHPEPFYWRDYPSNVQEFQQQASQWGFQGEYMVEEMVWRTQNDLTTETPFYTDIEAAKYAARANIMHLGLDFTMVSNQMLMPNVIKMLPRYYIIRNLSTVMAEAESVSLPFEIQSEATNIVSYTFTLPNAAHLVALWTDGVAVDDDPGISAMLTFPSITEHTVIGIDVLHGFQQRLVTSEEDGDLVIRELLVKDYPLILRVTPTKYMYLPTVFHGYGHQ